MARYPIRHESGKVDSRWEVSREYTGRATRCHVVRFCGDWQGRFDTEGEAFGFAAYSEDCRRRAIYPNGAPRRQWVALCSTARASWIKNPTPRDWPAMA